MPAVAGPTQYSRHLPTTERSPFSMANKRDMRREDLSMVALSKPSQICC